ncbi:sigma-70 family RNA polymerase sigma factor [Nocardiopsis trehalosi]|jgi:RNA polymerase sigma-70 factor (ECF subfamily)|uniref:sigma-70 family RNA polymerase sigma factor n=1 Tax=Nocardiopsis trehalosi TaxID=109329 RepID=UPI00082C2335|nr:sigma-70 family RNA polymerase sigma factor [Nocardiopsis trehalosi]
MVENSADELLARRFDEHRTRLNAVAYRMLGSMTEAEDAVQEAWFRLSRTGDEGIDNLAGWLTTVVGRVCLDMLRARGSRREDLAGAHVPDPVLAPVDGEGPEHEAVLADSVGLALLVVLDTLPPAERLAFVLHDMFGVSFADIAPIVDREPAAARQLASRARRRVRGAAPAPDPDLARQRRVVEAFLTAARGGDFEGLVRLLHPDATARADWGALRPGAAVVHGAEAVARQAATYAQPAERVRYALINGAFGIVVLSEEGRPFSVLAYTVVDGRIARIDALADPERLARLDLTALDA